MISIQAILFDVGGTLRANITKDQRDYSTIRGLMDFLGEDGDPAVFIEKIQIVKFLLSGKIKINN